MKSQRKEITKRVRNRLLLCVALFISCGMGFLILLDSRHLGSEALFSEVTRINAVDQSMEKISETNLCFVFSSYSFASVEGATAPKIETLNRPFVLAYHLPDLTLLFNKTLDFGDGMFYDIRLAQLIPDVNNDTYDDIFLSIANTSMNLGLSSGSGAFHNIAPNYNAYYNILISGINGDYFGGDTPESASFSSSPFTKVLWTDYNFSTGNKVAQRDPMPDLVGMYNISNDFYLDAYHVDVEATSPAPRLAWSLNNTETSIYLPNGPYSDSVFLNCTNSSNVVVLLRSFDNFLRVFPINGSYSYIDQHVDLLETTNTDLTGDGTDEVLCVQKLSVTPNLKINASVFDVISNVSLSISQTWEEQGTTNDQISDWNSASHMNVSSVMGFPTTYIWVETHPSGGWNSPDRKSYLWRVYYQTGGIQQLSPFESNFEGIIGSVVFTKFNKDVWEDIGLLLYTTDDNQFASFTVYDGLTGGVLDSFPAYQSFSDLHAITFIPDFGGDGKPDTLIIMGQRIITVSFETMFFWQQSLELTILFILCIVGFIFAFTIIIQWRRALRKAPLDDGIASTSEDATSMPEKGKEERSTKKRRFSLTKVIGGLIIGCVFLTLPLVLFLRIQNIGLPMQSSDVRLVHILTFVFLLFYTMIPMVAVLYNVAAPIYATSIFIKTQAQFIRSQPGKHDYRVLVLDYGTRQKRSAASYLTRSMFPILLAIAVGVNLFINIGHVGSLTSFNGSTEMQEWIVKFELLCSLPIILTFGLASFIVPSSWLLDDAGVVYFVENLQFREPGDISKISEWLLRYVKAIAGFTALISYVSLFLSTNFVITMQDNVVMSILMTMAVFAFIVGFPFLGGLVYMLVAQVTVENNLPALKEKLYHRMNVMGIDTTPRQLRDVLDPNDRAPKEFDKIWSKIRLPHKEKMSENPVGIDPPKQS